MTLETDEQKSLNQSEFRSFIMADFKKQMVKIDKMGWHMREHHSGKGERADSHDDGSRPHSAELGMMEAVKSPVSEVKDRKITN
mgnify:CR=1 FL=1|jgi:hypothetical protein